MTHEQFLNTYARSIRFLLENGRDVVQYRLHKDILHDLTPADEAVLLEKVKETDEYKLLLTHVKPDGYIGLGMHSADRFKASHLDDGENAARMLANYGIPKEDPIVRNYIAALRNDAVLDAAFSYHKPDHERLKNRSVGTNCGASLDTLFFTMQALLGYGEDPEVRPFVECAYRAFVSLLDIGSMDELTDYNPELKRKYNYPTITPETFFPCQYHLETLACTRSWRTPESVEKLIRAINHHDRILKPGDCFAVKMGGQQVGTAWAYMEPFHELSFPPKAPNHRKTLTALARVGGDRIDVVRRSADTLEEMLAEDGILRTTFESSYQKSRFKTGFVSGHPYAEVGLEPDHRKDTAIWVELTFWAVEFLYAVRRAEA